MDFRLNRETVPAAEVIFTGTQEQPVELDYILPDYCPDIFRLVRCEVTPVVTESAVIGDKLSYELRCTVRILYSGEDGALQSIEQVRSFTRSAELGRTVTDPEVELLPKPGHISFRAVNKRRLDLRGAVSVKLTVTGTKDQEVISDAFGMNIQLRKSPVRAAAKKLTADKIVELTEEAQIPDASAEIGSIVWSRTSLDQCELRLISGKLLAKGEAEIRVLYSGGGTVEPMSFSLSYSQIIDMDGVDESYDCRVSAEVLTCELSPVSDKSGSSRMIRCSLELRLSCTAVKTSTVMVATDAYSTVYPCEVTSSEIRAEQIPVIHTEPFRHSAVIAEGESVPAAVYAMWATPRNINTRLSEDQRGVVITGMLTYTCAARDGSGMLIMPDKDEAFEVEIPVGEELSGAGISAEVLPVSVTYSMGQEGALNAKAELSARISVTPSATVRALTEIVIDDSSKKERDGDYAIKLYYGTEGEDVWEIAKRCSTSVSAVMEENGLTGERLEQGGMLLIPMMI
ncbi:MAG: DUF3794 domain-containing protein [Ruminococcus sp.]|nr:DUF3794 domain-containing protein [Ruminococcus sp.]